MARSRSRSREDRRHRGGGRSRSRDRRAPARSLSRERRRSRSRDRRRSPERRPHDRDRGRSPPPHPRGGDRPHRSAHEEGDRGGRAEGYSMQQEQQHQRRGWEPEQREQRAMPAPERPAPGACFRCGQEGHISRDCPSAPPPGAGGGGGGGGRGACFKCGQEGHIARDCPNPEVPGAGGPGGRRRRGGDDGDANMAWGKPGEQDEEEQPDIEPVAEFGLSGALAAETNMVNGVVLLHQAPGEARKPTARWRLYVFKDGQQLEEPLLIHRNSSYLFGRERRVADIPIDHPSCSKQHAVLQYRLTEKEGADGMMHGAVRPYIMDLGSTNGTFLNKERIEPQRYYELLATDLLRFGNSTREYVLMKEK